MSVGFVAKRLDGQLSVAHIVRAPPCLTVVRTDGVILWRMILRSMKTTILMNGWWAGKGCYPGKLLYAR
jgi:hypothetical protein